MIKTHPFSLCSVFAGLLLATCSAYPQQEGKHPHPPQKPIPVGAKIYIAPFPGGFESFFAAGILKKKVPVVLVDDRSTADSEISGSAGTPGGWARGYRERATVQIVNVKTGEVVLDYYCQVSYTEGKRGLGQYCAEQLKRQIKSP
jgi:hypothetical protein